MCFLLSSFLYKFLSFYISFFRLFSFHISFFLIHSEVCLSFYISFFLSLFLLHVMSLSILISIDLPCNTEVKYFVLIFVEVKYFVLTVIEMKYFCVLLQFRCWLLPCQWTEMQLSGQGRENVCIRV